MTKKSCDNCGLRKEIKASMEVGEYDEVFNFCAECYAKLEKIIEDGF